MLACVCWTSRKPFDSVNHTILCQKLEAMVIDSAWLFESYLSDRHQLVCVDDTESQLKEIPCGVPQGSLLGPYFTFVIPTTWLQL